MPNPVRTLLGSATGLAQSRLALLATELREELGRFAGVLLGGCAAIALGALGFAAAAAALIIAAGEPYRLTVAFALAALFLSAAVAVAVLVRNAVRNRAGAFLASLAELEHDRAALLERAHDSRSALGESGGELMRLISLGLLGYTIGKRMRRAA